MHACEGGEDGEGMHLGVVRSQPTHGSQILVRKQGARVGDRGQRKRQLQPRGV